MDKFNRTTIYGLPMHASALPGHKKKKKTLESGFKGILKSPPCIENSLGEPRSTRNLKPHSEISKIEEESDVSRNRKNKFNQGKGDGSFC